MRTDQSIAALIAWKKEEGSGIHFALWGGEEDIIIIIIIIMNTDA